jgi:hypothetical protein
LCLPANSTIHNLFVLFNASQEFFRNFEDFSIHESKLTAKSVLWTDVHSAWSGKFCDCFQANFENLLTSNCWANVVVWWSSIFYTKLILNISCLPLGLKRLKDDFLLNKLDPRVHTRTKIIFQLIQQSNPIPQSGTSAHSKRREIIEASPNYIRLLSTNSCRNCWDSWNGQARKSNWWKVDH